MRPRSRQRAVVDAIVILALLSSAKAVGAAQNSRNSLSTTGRGPYPNGPCTVSAGNGDEVVGRLIPSSSCRMPRGVGPFPSPPENECLDCIPVADGYDGENLAGVEESWPGGEGAIAERTSLEDPQVIDLDLDKQLALVVADATWDVPVGGEEKHEEEDLNSIAGKLGEIATGILAAMAAAAAAAIASVVTGALTEAKAGTLSASPEFPHSDAFGTIPERSDPPAIVLSRREPGVEGQDAARLRGAGGEFHGGGWRDSAAGVGGDMVGPGVFGGDAGEAAEVVRRKMQTVTPAPTAAVSTSETAAPAPVAVETDAPADAETSAPAAVETDSPASVETDAPADAETNAPAAAPAAGETNAPVASETPAPTLGATPEASSEEELTISPTPVDGVTVFPSGTRAPGEAVATTISPTPVDGVTVSPSGTRAPGGTPSPSAAPTPSLTTSVGPTASPTSSDGPAPSASPTSLSSSISPSTMPPTSAPTKNNSSATDEATTPAPTSSNSSATEEAIATTGDVASGAVAVGVAATAAVATVTAVTATTVTTTAVTTTAASGTVTSTLTTTVTTAASAGTGGGASGTGAGVAATGTGTTTTSTTVVQSGTQTMTSANTRAGMQATRAGMRSSVQSNTAQGTSIPTVGVDQGSYVSARSPSASLGLLMILQIQFVSLLRLLEANITEPFMDFLDSIKWLSLHFEVDVSFLKCNDEDVRFSWSNDDNGTWAFNTFLVFGCLALLILIHILALSYMEASWLSQANAIHRHRLDLLRQHNAEEAAAPMDGRSSAAYARYLDAQNQDRELYEQEIKSAERYLRRHNSAWLYFPHIELLFLLFAYQGASAAEARMIYSGCLPLVVLGICAMVIFPVLMLIYVNRIVWNRLWSSKSPLVFRPNPEAKRGCGFLYMSLCCVCNAWRKGTSMFEWADKGEWVSKNDEDVDLDSRKFRIGFEPLFVDYTQRGTIYVSYLLFEWLVDGLVSGFVTNGTIQTGIIFLIYLVDWLILVCLRPFANTMIQCITTLTVLADVLTVALMCYASTLDEDDDSERLDYIYAGVLVIQTATIIFFVVPLYIDSFIVITGLLCRKMRGLYERTTKREKPPIKGSCGETTRIFFALVRENFLSCLKSTWKGPSYKPDSPGELERRRSNLLQPIDEVDSEDGVSFSYRSVLMPLSRVSAHLLPTARNPLRTSDRNALQDFSDHGSNDLMADAADDREQHQRRVSGGSVGAASRSSRGAPGYEREPPSERR